MNASDEHLNHLHERLAGAAAAEGILDVTCREVETPMGRLLLAATEQGLVRVAFEAQGRDELLSDLAERVSPRILESPERLEDAARQLDEYFAGRRRSFDLTLDRRLSSGFRAAVQSSLPRIGYGETRSYAEVAEMAGSPRAVRAVGSACATNPHLIVVPCHRVLRSDGSLGGYAGGVEAKTALLELESAGR